MHGLSQRGVCFSFFILLSCLGCRPQPKGTVGTVLPTVGAIRTQNVVWDVPASMKNRKIRDQGRGFKQKLVALTFDDGPSSNNTPQVLDTLDKYKIKATFFLVGVQMEQHPQLVKEIIKRGHAIGKIGRAHV